MTALSFYVLLSVATYIPLLTSNHISQNMDAAPQMTDRPTFDSPSRRGVSATSKNMWIVVGVLAVVAIIVVGWIVVSRFRGEEEPEASPTPQVFAEFKTPEPEEGEEEDVDKSEIAVEVLNGTGIAKEASYLQNKLGNLGYEDIETGNADAKTYDTAQVTFYKGFPEALKEELLKELKDIYTDVTDKDSSSESDVDVRIITGLRPGISRATPTPEPDEDEAEATDEPEESPTPTPTDEE